MNADKIGKPVRKNGFIFSFKAADTSDSSIIAYCWVNYNQGKIPNQKRYKIIYKNNRQLITNHKYTAYYKAGRKYFKLCTHPTLDGAKELIMEHWAKIWMPEPAHVEFEEVYEPHPAFTITGTVENLGSMSGNLIIQGQHGVVNYINNEGKVEQMEIKAISADLSAPNVDPVQRDTLYNTINPEQFCEKLTILAFRASVFLNAEYDVLPLPFAQGMVTGLIKQINAYRSAYHALNKPSTDLQTRLDIAASLKQYES